MKKTVLIVISIIILVALVIGTMYIIDRNRMKNNQPVVFSTWGYSYAPPVNISSEENNQKADNIVLNNYNIMRLVSYDVEAREINGELKELQKVEYPSTMRLSRALAVYVKSDIKQNNYDELHDIKLFYEGEDKNFWISMSMVDEPFTDHKDPNNKSNYTPSLINGNEVAILHNDNKDKVNNKIFYTCIFKYDEVYFVVETTNLSQEELVLLVKSIFNCDMKSIINEQENNPNYSFFATVVESNEKNIIVEPVEGSRELKSTDKISIGLGENNDAIYPVGTTIKVTYDGTIMETYPAKINASKIEIKSTDNFELIFNERKDLGIKTIISASETDKYSYNICSYGGDIAIKIDNTEYNLRDALLNNKITMEEIIAKANQDAFQDKTIEVDSYNDGGTNIYHYNNYTIIKFHTVEGNRDVYIGVHYMTLNDVK